ncbi:hypothetical protein LTR53_008767 [Teratosphaeriaceae sp. CCFEE 6253]|nr:hypothetical protein LTR53_008767 [Teratosphaeriaceae sp. CCFEE 6253]
MSLYITLTVLVALVDGQTTSMTAGVASLPPASSHTYTFTVTTPTTNWHAPTFATPAPVPPCSDTMCPALDGEYCVDAAGDMYGVLCNTRFSGTVITNSGKLRLRERDPSDVEEELGKRAYSGTFDNCADFCDSYDDPSAPCTGVAYHNGYCMSYDTITGTFTQAGGIAAVRQVAGVSGGGM